MLFTRPPETYGYAESLITSLLADRANPVRHTAGLFTPGSTVLDVGAGSGLLGRITPLLSPDVVLDGIEVSPEGTEVASAHYRHFLVGYAQDHVASIAEAQYDFVVLNDVIEHVVDPAALLESLREAAGPRCTFIISTPNIGYVGARLHLLDGRFEYVDSGIMERTHVRFFTLPTLVRLFEESGLHIRSTTRLQRRLRETEFAPLARRRNLAALRRVLADETASTYQYLFVLSSDPESAVPDSPAELGVKDTLLRVAAGR